MVFLSDSKSPQGSWTLINIRADLINSLVWMVSTRLLISKSSSPFINPLVTVPSVLITIGITATSMSHIFFNSLSRTGYLSLCLPFFSFTLWSAGTANSVIRQIISLSLWICVCVCVCVCVCWDFNNAYSANIL